LKDSARHEFGTLAPKLPEIDFAIVLSRVIGSVNDDPAQLRDLVYELARIKLQTELLQRDPPINSETRHLALALESAIDRVEAVYSKHDRPRALQSLDQLANSWEVGAPKITVEPSQPELNINQPPAPSPHRYHLPSFATRPTDRSRNASPSWHWMGAAPLVRAAMVAIPAVALCAVLDYTPVVQKIERIGPTPVLQTSTRALQSPTTTLPSQSLGFPLPSVYGVYAVSGGQLHELEPLVGRVPDQRVFMSTPVKTPSRTVLPDGRTLFIIYRRDAANSAPERVSVRVIAKILRAMTFNTAGLASTTNVEDLWTIRNISYEFRVAPLGESSEMLMIRPENEEFVFPAGRYGLVIKGQAYDFTVAGPVTETAQCLEGVKAENGTFYSECRHPKQRQL
jgi:hypothetical protein